MARMSRTPVLPRTHARARPLPTVALVPNPGPRFGVGARIQATLMNMVPGSHESFLVEDTKSLYKIANKIGIGVTTRAEGGKYRVWRVA